MRLSPTPAQEAFRTEVRDYFTSVVTDDVRAAVADDAEEARDTYRAFVRKVGADGWLTPTWPTEWGGRGLSPIEQLIFFDETQRLRVPMPFLTTNTVGPTIMRYGTDEQKEAILPRIRAGGILFSIGYSEPDAGTDLASLRTRAEPAGDDLVVNGQKMWTSLVHVADYIWLAVRTDPDAPKHEGISILLVPTDADGFSWTRVDTIGGGLTSATYFEDVAVPRDAVVGELNGGWRLITAQLNAERIALASAGQLQRRLDETTRFARDARLADGRRLIDEAWVQRILAEVTAELSYLRLLNWKVAWEATQDGISATDASTMKVYGSELFVRAYRRLAEITGPRAIVTHGQPDVALGGELEDEMRRSLILTFGGGTNEIQRSIIATLGLGMPRPPR